MICNSNKKFCLSKLIKCPFGSKNNIAVVNLSGVIGKVGKFEQGINIDNVDLILEKAFATKNLKAVAINVNSPGGSPVQSELIYQRIKELSLEKKIPVFTFAQDIAASGGYFLLCAGEEIFAHHASIIGSIGVISAGFGFEEAIKKIGVNRRIYAEGKNKAVLDPFSKEDQESIAILKNAQKDVFESFKNIVRENRKNKLKRDEEELFNGAFWAGKTAVEIGLVDEIGSMRNIMKKKFGDKIKFINIEPKKKGILRDFILQRTSSFNSDLIENLFKKVGERIFFNRFGL